MQKRANEITMLGKAVTILGKPAQIGETAEDFTVSKADLSEVHLSDYQGKVVVIAVFPSIDTPVCQMQLTKFNHEAASFSPDVQLLTISCDLPFALGRYCSDKGIANAVTTSDHKALDFGLKYGFVIEELRLLTRGTVIIDKHGKIAYVEYVKENGNEPDYAKALEIIKSLTV